MTFSIRAKGVTFDFDRDPRRVLVMGVLNVTPDSFSDGALYEDPDRAYEHACSMIAAGADIIDVGAESTRPGADPVSCEEEVRRLLPVVEALIKNRRAVVSVDTSKAAVADECLSRGAHIINDVSGCRNDSDMARVVAKHAAGIILMHMRGTPSTMQQYTRYTDLIGDIITELRESVKRVSAAGVSAESIIIDPGIGFAKTVEQNCAIIRRLREFHVFGRPVLIGPSRKSFIGKTLQRDVDERLSGTLAAVGCAMQNGMNIVRVHDVRETSDFIAMTRAICDEKQHV